MMSLLVIIVSVYLHAFYAKELAHDVKEVLLQSHNQDPNVDELLNLLYMDTTTQKYFGYPDRTTATPPYFVKTDHSPNNTVQLGAEITLHCRVNDLADHTTVSWMKRHGDKLKLVSVGLEAYSSDPRYAVQFRAPNDWQLKLQSAQNSDEGHYECQVSSHPPIVQPYYLTVVVPEMNIADERGHPIKNKYYNSGSTIELQCTVNKVPEAQNILWKLGTKVLNFDNSRGGISVKAEVTDNGALSRLFIANSNPHDSGNYTCALGDIAQSSVTVVVLNGKDGEAPAAMHIGAGSQLVISPVVLIGTVIALFAAEIPTR